MTGEMSAEFDLTREIPDAGMLGYRDKSHSYTLVTGLTRRRLAAVSTLVGTLDKPALTRRGGWIERNAVVGAYQATRQGLLDDVPDEDKWASVREMGFGLAKVDDRAQGGTIIHGVMEQLATTGVAPDPAGVDTLARPWVQAAVRAWMKLDVRRVVEQEGIVCHPELGYAGRFDLLCYTVPPLSDPMLTLVDYKSSTKGAVWGEASWQTRLYAMAIRRTLGLEVERIVIVGLGPSGTSELIECATSEEKALELISVYRHRQEIEKSMRAQRKAAA